MEARKDVAREVQPAPKTGENSRRIFVAYPWDLYDDREIYKRIYTDLERPLEVEFVFAEERFSDAHVLDKIIGMIRESTFGIYDVSGWNPNVTLEYGVARGLGTRAFIAFNPAKTKRDDVPADVRGYDRLQYASLDDLNSKVASLVRQELGLPGGDDPLERDRQELLGAIARKPGSTARELGETTGLPFDYVQLLIRRSADEFETSGATKGTRYKMKRKGTT
jgi:hypothetical protein